jgi:Bacterial regulatory helix-turn-helix protein, lysR family
MTLDQLHTFQTVAATKSFRRAAELLSLTQPAVSKQIQALETELEQRLFERGRSRQLSFGRNSASRLCTSWEKSFKPIRAWFLGR